MKISDFIPSTIMHLYSRPNPKVQTIVYESYEGALKDCLTHEDSAGAQYVLKKTQKFVDSLSEIRDGNNYILKKRRDVQDMFVFTFCCANGLSNRPLEVLDMGGGCGKRYFILNHLLPGMIKKWFVVETQAVVDVARERFSSDRLKFFSNSEYAISEFENLNLLYLGGFLQCLGNPLKALDNLLKLGFKYVYLTYTRVSEGIDTPIFVKKIINISGDRRTSRKGEAQIISYPMTILPYRSFISHLKRNDKYKVIFIFDECNPFQILRLPEGNISTKMAGFLLERH